MFTGDTSRDAAGFLSAPVSSPRERRRRRAVRRVTGRRVRDEFPVADRQPGHAALEQLRRLRQRHQRRVAAVARARDADAGRIREALLDRPLRRVLVVLLHLPADRPEPAVVDLRTQARRAAEVGNDDRVAARREDLRLADAVRELAPAVGAHRRPAVDVKHGGKLLAGLVVARQEVVRRNLQPVARLQAERTHLDEVVRLDPRPAGQHLFERLLLLVEEVPLDRLPVGVRRDEQAIAVGRPREPVDRSGQRAVEHALQARVVGVGPDGFGLVALHLVADDVVVRRVAHQAGHALAQRVGAHVVARVLRRDLAQLPGVRVVLEHRHRVPALVGRHQQRLVVGLERERHERRADRRVVAGDLLPRRRLGLAVVDRIRLRVLDPGPRDARNVVPVEHPRLHVRRARLGQQRPASGAHVQPIHVAGVGRAHVAGRDDLLVVVRQRADQFVAPAHPLAAVAALARGRRQRAGVLAFARDHEQAAAVGLARPGRRVELSKRVQDAVVADPVHRDHVEVREVRERVALARLEVDDDQVHPAVDRRGGREELAVVRQHRAGDVRVAHEVLDRQRRRRDHFRLRELHGRIRLRLRGGADGHAGQHGSKDGSGHNHVHS